VWTAAEIRRILTAASTLLGDVEAPGPIGGAAYVRVTDLGSRVSGFVVGGRAPESCLRVRIETKVAPGTHFEVKRMLHRLLVEGFRENNLEIPYPKSIGIELSGDAPSASAPKAAPASS
jgi:hypothetical protein